MDVKFTLKAECIVKNADHKATSTIEIEKEIEKMLDFYCGIIARVKLCDLTYVMKGRVKDE